MNKGSGLQRMVRSFAAQIKMQLDYAVPPFRSVVNLKLTHGAVRTGGDYSLRFTSPRFSSRILRISFIRWARSFSRPSAVRWYQGAASEAFGKAVSEIGRRCSIGAIIRISPSPLIDKKILTSRQNYDRYDIKASLRRKTLRSHGLLFSSTLKNKLGRGIEWTKAPPADGGNFYPPTPN